MGDRDSCLALGSKRRTRKSTGHLKFATQSGKTQSPASTRARLLVPSDRQEGLSPTVPLLICVFFVGFVAAFFSPQRLLHNSLHRGDLLFGELRVRGLGDDA